MEVGERAKSHADRTLERRIHARFATDEGAIVLLLDHGICTSGRLIDLSEGGCQLRTAAPFVADLQTRVEIAFRIHGMAFRFVGVVEWASERNLVGVRFVDMAARHRIDMSDLLLEAEANVAARAAKDAPKIFLAKPQSQSRSGDEKKFAQVQSQAGETEHQAESGPDSGQDSAPSAIVGQDRRMQSRMLVDTSAEIFLIHIGSHVKGRILDISLGGCRIHTDERFPVGIYTRVEIEFRMEEMPFRLLGVIQAVHDQQRQLVGIRFLDTSTRKKQQLELLIEEMKEAREN